MKMKSIYAFLFSLLLMFSGCENNKGYEVAPARLIGLSLAQPANEYVNTVATELSRKFKEQGYSLIITNADSKIENQQKQVAALLKQNVKALLLSAPEGDFSESMAPINEAGIPFVNVVRPLADATVVDAVVLPDAVDEGRLAARFMNEALETGKYQMLYMTGSATESELTQWQDGLSKELNAGITKFSNPLACVDSLSALSRAKNILSRDVQVCVALDDVALQGFVVALAESGKTLNDVKIIVFSGSPKSKSLLKEGKISAIIARSPQTAAQQMMDACLSLLQGQMVEKTWVKSTLITVDNIAEYDVNKWE